MIGCEWVFFWGVSRLRVVNIVIACNMSKLMHLSIELLFNWCSIIQGIYEYQTQVQAVQASDMVAHMAVCIVRSFAASRQSADQYRLQVKMKGHNYMYT
jgi:hypothetical protein